MVGTSLESKTPREEAKRIGYREERRNGRGTCFLVRRKTLPRQACPMPDLKRGWTPVLILYLQAAVTWDVACASIVASIR